MRVQPKVKCDKLSVGHKQNPKQSWHWCKNSDQLKLCSMVTGSHPGRKRNRKLNPTWPETWGLSSNSPFAVFAASVEEPREEPELVRRSSVRFGLVVARVLDDGSEDFVVGLGPEVVEAGDEKKRVFSRPEILSDSNPRPLCQEACALPLCCNRSPS